MYFSGKLLSESGYSTGNFEDVQWKPVSEFKLEELINKNEIWYRMPLPVIEVEQPVLCLSPKHIHGIGVFVLICAFGYILINHYKKTWKKAQDYAFQTISAYTCSTVV